MAGFLSADLFPGVDTCARNASIAIYTILTNVYAATFAANSYTGSALGEIQINTWSDLCTLSESDADFIPYFVS